MKKSKVIATLLVAGLMIAGCDKNNAIQYPQSVQNSAGNDQVSAEMPKRVDKNIVNQDGKIIFTVNADVIGSTDDILPVYEVEKRNFTGEELTEMCKNIFDDGSINYILPIGAANREYLNSRLQTIDSIKKECMDSGSHAPLGFIFEEEEIEQILDSYDTSVYKLQLPQNPDWVDMKDYYLENYGVEGEGRFFAAEGLIENEYWEFDAIDYNGNIMIELYKIDYSTEYPTMIAYDEDEKMREYLGINDAISREEAIIEASEFYNKLEISGFEFNNTNPLVVHELEGVYDDEGLEVSKVNEDNGFGYQVNFSRMYGGSMQLYDAYSDYFNMIFYPNGVCSSLYYMPYVYDEYLETLKSDATVTSYGGCYESISFAADENGVFSMLWSSPMEVVERKTDNAVLLEFDKILKRADDAFGMIDKRSYDYNDKVYSIELKMARISETAGKYTMVPAWYFITKGYNSSVREDAKVCINAIDGSIIDLSTGKVLEE